VGSNTESFLELAPARWMQHKPAAPSYITLYGVDSN